jgi:hypothetical protein
MSRGVVLWPDNFASSRIRDLWQMLAARGLSSMATHTHKLHQPHVSLIVAEDLPVIAVLEAVGSVPPEPIPFRIEAVGVFPGGFLFLACVANEALLAEQRRVHNAAEPFAVKPWPYFRPGTWTPHITTGWALSDEQLAAALPVLLTALPIHGCFDHGGVEDGTTAEHWPAATES